MIQSDVLTWWDIVVGCEVRTVLARIELMPFQHDLIRSEAAAGLRKGLSESHECTAEFSNRRFLHVENQAKTKLVSGTTQNRGERVLLKNEHPVFRVSTNPSYLSSRKKLQNRGYPICHFFSRRWKGRKLTIEYCRLWEHSFSSTHIWGKCGQPEIMCWEKCRFVDFAWGTVKDKHRFWGYSQTSWFINNGRPLFLTCQKYRKNRK